jgi:hypothetical protein
MVHKSYKLQSPYINIKPISSLSQINSLFISLLHIKLKPGSAYGLKPAIFHFSSFFFFCDAYFFFQEIDAEERDKGKKANIYQHLRRTLGGFYYLFT